MAEVAQRRHRSRCAIRFDGRAPPPPQMYFRGPVLTRFDGTEWTPLGLRVRAGEHAVAAADAETRGTPMRLRDDARAAAPRVGAAARGDDRHRRDRRLPRGRCATTCSGSPTKPVFERLRFEATASTTLRPRRAAPHRRAAGRASSCRPASTRARSRGRARCARPARRGATRPSWRRRVPAAHPHAAASATRSRPATMAANGDRRVLARPQGGLLRALRRRLRRRHARRSACRRASSPATRAPTCRRSTATTIVRQSSAHAWAEFWQPASAGCAPIRPRAVAPDRISAQPPARAAAGLRRRARSSDDEPAAARASCAAPGKPLNNRWNQWVLNYSRGQQLDVLKQIGFVTPTWEDLALLLDRHAERRWRSPARSGPGSIAIASTPGCASSKRMKRALQPLGVPAAPRTTPPRALARACARAPRRRRRAARAALLDAPRARSRYSRAAARAPRPGA